MKKYLLPIILSLMLLAVPVTADAPYRLIVDGVAVDKPVVIIDGVSYAPIRAVADIFEATTDWDGATNTVSIKKKGLERPPIEGDAEFVKKINAALDLLEEKDFPHYVMVCENTFDIAPLERNPKILKDALALHVAGSTRITRFFRMTQK
ncbi:MAG: stalk domain-containing protein [Peptococcia bacterium]